VCVYVCECVCVWDVLAETGVNACVCTCACACVWDILAAAGVNVCVCKCVRVCVRRGKECVTIVLQRCHGRGVCVCVCVWVCVREICDNCVSAISWQR